MPVTYAIRPALKVVLMVFEGVVTDDELRDGQRKLFNDKRFTGPLARIVDCTRATNIAAKSETIRSMAIEAVRRGMTVMAIVAPEPAVYGVSRMYQECACEADCQIFQELRDAIKWLAQMIGPYMMSNQCSDCHAPMRGLHTIHSFECSFYLL